MPNAIQTFCDQCGAVVAQNARFCRQCGYDLSSAAVPPGSRTDVQPGTIQGPYPPFGDQRKVGSYDAPLVAAIFFNVVGVVAGFFAPNDFETSEEAAGLYVLIVLGLLVPGVISSCILLYRWWATLPPGWRQTTPAKAVAYSFIPFYCFYWWFIAYGGLASDVNRFLDVHGIEGERAQVGLAHGYVIVTIVSLILCWVPVLTNLIGIVGLILYIAFALSATRACKRLSPGQRVS